MSRPTIPESSELVTALRAALAEHWLLFDVEPEPLGGGMNSLSYAITARDRRYVAKWVPRQSRAALLRGCQLASRLVTAGIPTGFSLPTVEDHLIAPCAGGWVTLMTWVEGQPLTGETPDEQQIIGRALGYAHNATADARPERSFPAWLREDRSAHHLEPWIRPEIEAAVAAYDALPPLVWVCLHTDPTPGAFLVDEVNHRVGIIDWTGATPGPALYDVASAIIYLGGREHARAFIAGYHDTGPVLAGDWQHLQLFERFRWTVQAAYFAERIAAGDLTGTDEAGNLKGLHDAKVGLGLA